MFRLKRPSPAMVVALLALVFSLGGSAIAAKHYLIHSTKQISPKVLKKLRGRQGPRGFPGQNGTNGTNATVLGYADITVSGTSPAIQNFTTPFRVTAANVDRVSAGEYCFKNLPFTPHTAIVSADNSFGANNTIASVVVAGNSVICPSGDDLVRVRTVNVPGGGSPNVQQDEPFTIWFN